MEKILVVDDIKDNVKLLSYDLGDENYEILCAYNGQQALEIAQEEAPDVILLDIMMPGMDGIEVCKRLKTSANTREIPIIIISAKDREQDIISGLDAGAVDYIAKPFVYPIVAARVRSAIRIKKSQDLLNQMNNRMDNARQIAEDASRSKSDFLASMSHEIRTPLNGVLGMTSLLLNTQLNQEQHDYAATIQTAGNSLFNLINDILDFSKIEAGKLQIENIDFDLHDTVQNATEVLKSRVVAKGLEITTSIEPDLPQLVAGDPSRLEQILINLISNAIKFTDSGTIKIKVSSHKEPLGIETQIKFEVFDTGIGLSNEQRTGIFNAYQQALTSTTRQYGGTGLGLNICQKLIHLMGGEIGVESELDKGSNFWFILPYTSRDEYFVTQVVRKEIKGATVLIVDHEESSRNLLEHQLGDAGCDITSTHSVSLAQEIVENLKRKDKSFGLIIIDQNISNSSGITLANELVDDFGFPAKKILMLLSQPCSNDKFRRPETDRFGATLTKPTSKYQLLHSVSCLYSSHYASTHKSINSNAKITKLDQLGDLKILVAEDNSINQQVIMRMLLKMGFVADLVENGQQAIDAAHQHHYDLIFMDVDMPSVNGIDATKAIRALPKFRDTPIVALTAHALQEYKENCLQAGMSDFLAKPVHPQTLSAMICKWAKKNTKDN
ncbi:MAG: hypothetical protein COB04_12210 [Gammaproteobacteria bacterium]|nr:MAG: hypothetical protein COB04_12210 [Gammaproteobacteria bacterium]